MSQKLPADSVKELGPDDVSKSAIRTAVWKYIEENDLADFPRPVNRRIPNVKGAATAADFIPTMQEFKTAQTVKVNPDKPQEQARFLTLDAGKNLLVPTPRLRNGLFNRINVPAGATKDVLRICSTSQGVREHSETVSLDDKVKIDLVIVGSVAVSKSGRRIGKGEGFADLEWAMMRSMGAVGPDTVIITTVQDYQVIDIPEKLMGEHDLTVDYIVTPSGITKCTGTAPKPAGIYWSKLEPSKLKRIPVLRKLMAQEREAGVDVTLKDGKVFDLEAAEKEDREREERRAQEEGEEGEGDGRRRRFNRYRRGRFGRGRGRGGRGGRGGSRGERTESEGPEGEEREHREHREPRERGEQGEGEGEGKPRRRNRRMRRPPGGKRRGKDSEGEGHGDGYDKEGETSEGEGKENRRRPQKRFRPRRGRQPALFVGGLPRSLRVSTFKSEVRGREVDPLRVIWHGGNGHAFLQFENQDLMENALKALAELDINGKKLRVEEAHQGRRSQDREGDAPQQAEADAQ